jgi:hypothetical protein
MALLKDCSSLGPCLCMCLCWVIVEPYSSLRGALIVGSIGAFVMLAVERRHLEQLQAERVAHHEQVLAIISSNSPSPMIADREATGDHGRERATRD